MHIITGGAGFLGSALVWALNNADIDNILIVDNLGHTEKWRNLVPRRFAHYMHRDVFLRHVHNNSLPYSVKSIVHFGACSDTTQTNADFLMANNLHYSQALCLFALKHGARYIHASSAATYGSGGDDSGQSFDDDIASLHCLRPLNMYGYSKHLFDMWALREGLLDRIVSLKFFNVYGPNEYHKGAMRSVVCKAHDEILHTAALRLFRSTHKDYADGGQMRDFVYVKDVARAVAWLLHHTHVNGLYNVGTGTARTWNDLAKAVFAAMERPIAIEYIDMPDNLRGKYQNYTCAPLQRLLATGCPPCDTALEDGVYEYVREYLHTTAYL